MREIKFRASKGCNFVYGQLVYDAAGMPRITEVDKSGLGLTFHNCRKGTESQYTGLKDCNGKEIYEGDILEFMHHKHKVFRIKGGLVINSHPADWNKNYTPFYEACADMQTSQWMEQCTITGNVYENKNN